MEKYGRERQSTDNNIIRHMRIACGIPKTTNTQSEYVILIACPRQQWLHERASVLRYTYVACLFRTCTWICNILVGSPTLTAVLRFTVYFKYLKTEYHPNLIWGLSVSHIQIQCAFVTKANVSVLLKIIITIFLELRATHSYIF